MKKYYFFLLVLVISCSQPPTRSNNSILVKTALSYKGTPYKYAGHSNQGMDCSGLVFKSFGDLGIKVPRISKEQALIFPTVSKKKIRVGDLVYFKIGKTRGINHTGIVTAVVNHNTVRFIHSSSSAGVREDNLYSKYWTPKFVKATRPNL